MLSLRFADSGLLDNFSATFGFTSTIASSSSTIARRRMPRLCSTTGFVSSIGVSAFRLQMAMFCYCARSRFVPLGLHFRLGDDDVIPTLVLDGPRGTQTSGEEYQTYSDALGQSVRLYGIAGSESEHMSPRRPIQRGSGRT